MRVGISVAQLLQASPGCLHALALSQQLLSGRLHGLS